MSRLRLLTALLSLLVGVALAQPYAAAGGFGRPVLEESRAIAASVSVTVSLEGTVTTVWAGTEGVWRLDRTADGRNEAQLLVATDDVRSISAAYVADELVVTWISRDRNTGHYDYSALLAGRQVALFQDSLVVDLRLFEYQEQPYAAGLFRRDGQGQLILLNLLTGEQRAVYRTHLSQRGLDVLPMQDGRLWLGWLEGRNERGEFGLISEWDAYVALLPAPGAVLAGPAGLGAAYVEDERQRVALLSDPALGAAADSVWVLWSDEETDLRLTAVTRDGSDLLVEGSSAPMGQGRPIGAAWPNLYWVSDASVMRLDVTGEGPTSVAWSPVTMEGADFATASVLAAGGPRSLSAVAWYGRAQGGAIEIYSSDDRVPMQVTLLDRVAALMNWNPWHLWDELLGQLLTALLVGIIGGITMVPLLMVVGPLLGRAMRGSDSAIGAGLVAGLAPLALGVLVYRRGFPTPADLQLILVATGTALVVGVLCGWFIGRRGDRELHGTFTVVGAVAMFAGAAVFSFITYRQWGPLVGLS